MTPRRLALALAIALVIASGLAEPGSSLAQTRIGSPRGLAGSVGALAHAAGATSAALPTPTPTAPDRSVTPEPRVVIALEDYAKLLEQAADDDLHSRQAASSRLAGGIWVKLRSGDLAYVQPMDGFLKPPAGTPTPETAPVRETRRRARLDLVRAQLGLSAEDDTAGRLRELQKVLGRPEFQEDLSWWERVVRWLADHLPDPPSSPVAAALTRLFGYGLLLVGAAILALVIGRWLVGLWRSMAREAELRRQAGGDVPVSARVARKQALTLAASGNYREAVRQLYLAALLRLEEAGLFAFDRSLTNREVLARLAGWPSLAAQLAPIVGTYDDVWYGVHEPDASTFTAYAERIDRLEETLRSPTKAAT